MAAKKDPRRCVGVLVHSKATAVTSIAQCNRLYVALSKHKLVNGTVLKVVLDRSSGFEHFSTRIMDIIHQTYITENYENR